MFLVSDSGSNLFFIVVADADLYEPVADPPINVCVYICIYLPLIKKSIKFVRLFYKVQWNNWKTKFCLNTRG